jgi:hypothetical protein
MDAKITLSFDEAVIKKAKKYAEDNNISLSRLTEMLYKNMTSQQYKSISELPISDWVYELAEGQPEYVTKKRRRKTVKEEYYESRKKK